MNLIFPKRLYSSLALNMLMSEGNRLIISTVPMSLQQFMAAWYEQRERLMDIACFKDCCLEERFTKRGPIHLFDVSYQRIEGDSPEEFDIASFKIRNGRLSQEE